VVNDAKRAHDLFGPPTTRVEDMIEWIVAWLALDGPTWQKPTGFDRRDGRF